MPKIIPELREKIMRVAKSRLIEGEARDFSIRQLAKDCGVAAGTVFNYFASKEELLASIMLEDWQLCLLRMNRIAEKAGDIREGLKGMELELRGFSEPYESVWISYDRKAPIKEYHEALISQLKLPLKTLIERLGYGINDTELIVITEMLLTASQRKSDTINKLLPVIEKLLKG